MATPVPFETSVASSAIPEETWYAFYSENEKREYYFNPITRVSTWILPAGARRFTDPRMIETNPGFTPSRPVSRFSLDMFDDHHDHHDDDEDSVHSEGGTWRERSVLKANLIVLGAFFIGLFISASWSALDMGGILNRRTQEVAEIYSMNRNTNIEARAEERRGFVYYYPSWLNVLSNPFDVFPIEDMNPTSQYTDVSKAQNTEEIQKHSNNGQPKDHFNESKHAFYYPSWWNVLENSREPPRDLKLDQLVNNLESSLEAAEVLLNKIVIDAQHAGMELRATFDSE